jgi:hypothetical protein
LNREAKDSFQGLQLLYLTNILSLIIRTKRTK